MTTVSFMQVEVVGRTSNLPA